MNDKEKIYLQACLYAINKLTEKGSCRYSWKDNNGKWNSIAWDEIMDWVLEKRGAKSETATLNKIRVEIEQRSYSIANDDVIQGMKYERRDILKIIDKYRTENKILENEISENGVER